MDERRQSWKTIPRKKSSDLRSLRLRACRSDTGDQRRFEEAIEKFWDDEKILSSAFQLVTLETEMSEKGMARRTSWRVNQKL